MITEVIRYRIPTDQASSFEMAYAAACKFLSASPHCLGYELLHGSEEPERWVLLIRWASAEAHLGGFRTSAEFPPFFKLVQPYFAQIEEMKHYSGTSLTWTR
jgi:quinol monooxygenase YgiN